MTFQRCPPTIRFDRALEDAEITDTAPRVSFEKDTAHFSVADRFGNVVAATMSLGRGWGAGTAAPGLGFPHNALLEGFDYPTLPAAPTSSRRAAR